MPPLTKLHILILPSFPISSTNWGPGIQTYQPMEAILVQATIALRTTPSPLNVPLTLLVLLICACVGPATGVWPAYWGHIPKNKRLSLSQLSGAHRSLAGWSHVGPSRTPYWNFSCHGSVGNHSCCELLCAMVICEQEIAFHSTPQRSL